jgi:putative endonuclease
MFYVYVLQSTKTGRRYVGSCENLDDRIRRHNLGHSKATHHGIPWTLIHSEGFPTRADAARKERYYKSGRGRDELTRLSAVRSPRRQVAGSNPGGPIVNCSGVL